MNLLKGLGEQIINESAGLFSVNYPDPEESHIFVWSSGASEQLEAVVARWLGLDAEGYSEASKNDKHVFRESSKELVNASELTDWEEMRQRILIVAALLKDQV